LKNSFEEFFEDIKLTHLDVTKMELERQRTKSEELQNSLKSVTDRLENLRIKSENELVAMNYSLNAALEESSGALQITEGAVSDLAGLKEKVYLLTESMNSSLKLHQINLDDVKFNVSTALAGMQINFFDQVSELNSTLRLMLLDGTISLEDTLIEMIQLVNSTMFTVLDQRIAENNKDFVDPLVTLVSSTIAGDTSSLLDNATSRLENRIDLLQETFSENIIETRLDIEKMFQNCSESSNELSIAIANSNAIIAKVVNDVNVTVMDLILNCSAQIKSLNKDLIATTMSVRDTCNNDLQSFETDMRSLL
jgi:hypothetical protein